MLFRAPVKERAGRAPSQLKVFAAPIGGWVANRNIAQPQQPGQPQAAVVLDNFFPLATSAVLRRGCAIYATLGHGNSPATAMFTYSAGSVERLFAANADTIYDITTVFEAENALLVDDLGNYLIDDLGNHLGVFSTAGLEVWEGYTGGNWITTQFATSGDIFLVGVNGEDDGFIYDGDTFYPWVAGGIRVLHYAAATNPFTTGLTLTGLTSGATGAIVKVIDNGDGSGRLWLRDVAGTFQDVEMIADSGSGSALADGLAAIAVPGPTFPNGLTIEDMSFVFAYGRRLFFIRRDTLEYYYLPVDQVGGTATAGYLGAVFNLGGSLVFGQSWSTDSGSGLSAQCVFATTEGEVAVYRGLDPGDANDWSIIGAYRVGVPLGPRGFIRAGGDLILASSVGFVPLSQAVARDYAALFQAAVSYNIEDAWNTATSERGMEGWHCTLWAEGQMVLVVPPFSADNEPVIFAANARTGAWARFTNWRATCSVVFRGGLYFGTDTGQIMQGSVGGSDNGINYTGDYKPLFEDFGASAALKVGQMARPVMRAASPLNLSVRNHTDFDVEETVPPAASPVSSGSDWGSGIWGESIWGGKRKAVITQDWKSIGGIGYALSVGVQVTSGSVAPLDAEIIRTEVTYQTADIVT